MCGLNEGEFGFGIGEPADLRELEQTLGVRFGLASQPRELREAGIDRRIDGAQAVRVERSALANEKLLEDILAADIGLLARSTLQASGSSRMPGKSECLAAVAAQDDEETEWVVPISWVKTVPGEQAIGFKGR